MLVLMTCMRVLLDRNQKCRCDLPTWVPHSGGAPEWVYRRLRSGNGTSKKNLSDKREKSQRGPAVEANINDSRRAFGRARKNFRVRKPGYFCGSRPAGEPSRESFARKARSRRQGKRIAGTTVLPTAASECFCGSRPAGEPSRESFARKARSHEHLEALLKPTFGRLLRQRVGRS